MSRVACPVFCKCWELNTAAENTTVPTKFCSMMLTASTQGRLCTRIKVCYLWLLCCCCWCVGDTHNDWTCPFKSRYDRNTGYVAPVPDVGHSLACAGGLYWLSFAHRIHALLGGSGSVLVREVLDSTLVINLGYVSSQDPRMGSSGYVTNSWEYGADLIFHHWIVPCTHLFRGWWKNVAKNLRVPSFSAKFFSVIKISK